MSDDDDGSCFQNPSASQSTRERFTPISNCNNNKHYNNNKHNLISDSRLTELLIIFNSECILGTIRIRGRLLYNCENKRCYIRKTQLLQKSTALSEVNHHGERPVSDQTYALPSSLDLDNAHDIGSLSAQFIAYT